MTGRLGKMFFDYFDKRWGPHTCDRFACHYNTKCLKFNSKYWCTRTSGINALQRVWTGEVNWVVPPPTLIPEVIRKIEIEKCICTLVCPEWVSAPFWSMLFEGGVLKSYIKNYAKIEHQHAIFPGRGNNGMFGKNELVFNIIFFRIVF